MKIIIFCVCIALLANLVLADVKLSTADIVGITLACIAGVACLTILIIFCNCCCDGGRSDGGRITTVE